MHGLNWPSLKSTVTLYGGGGGGGGGGEELNYYSQRNLEQRFIHCIGLFNF